MTCNLRYDDKGKLIAIVCSRGPTRDEMGELKRAMACRKWEICEKCESVEVCRRVLAKRKEGENGKNSNA